MTVPRTIAVCLLLLGLAACSSGENSASQVPPATDSVPLVIAHRGASAYAPEHTIAAYDLAIDMGADYIEQDVQMTADGVLVVLHDASLARTARGEAGSCSGQVGNKTLAQLKSCDFGSWFNEAYPDRADEAFVGLQIPALAEVFERYGRSVNYYIETKETNPFDDGIEQALLGLLRDYELLEPAMQRRQVLIQSFHRRSLTRMHALEPGLPLIQLANAGTARLMLSAASQIAVGIGPSLGDVDADFIEDAHALGLDVHPYTVNSEEDLQRMIELCVDGAFSNFPDRMVELRDGAPACAGDRAAP